MVSTPLAERLWDAVRIGDILPLHLQPRYRWEHHSRQSHQAVLQADLLPRAALSPVAPRRRQPARRCRGAPPPSAPLSAHSTAPPGRLALSPDTPEKLDVLVVIARHTCASTWWCSALVVFGMLLGVPLLHTATRRCTSLSCPGEPRDGHNTRFNCLRLLPGSLQSANCCGPHSPCLRPRRARRASRRPAPTATCGMLGAPAPWSDPAAMIGKPVN